MECSASTDCDDITSHPKILSWKENTDCCSWDGVTCDRVTGHVIGLDLSCGQLQGTIHSNSSLFLLPHLQRLNLAFNDFYHSPISSEFGQFASLTHFNLSQSNFSGHIPSEISHLSKLVSLDLSVGYDSTQGSLLRLLRLDKPNMKKLVQNLTELRMLDLSIVDLSSVDPSSLMNLSSSLTTLRLQSCGLRGKFPNNIFHLPNLQTLYLGFNHNLTGYFPKFNGSSPLKDLDLRGLSFSGELLDSISNLHSLKFLALSGYNFSESILTWFGNLTQISTLWLYSNNFSGPIPSSFSKLKHLTDLDLSYNHFSGQFSIPIAIVVTGYNIYLDPGP
ncbi:hypothetical protein L1049_017465 [Liquidambar formosana]|uniref:Leucine-rich repeat-containing N-terminal plant-type domain-containing protein n=1 Tax=Liquidambar formosana TaxID=63359 RepID=A0AAP0S8J1_LIQFO